MTNNKQSFKTKCSEQKLVAIDMYFCKYYWAIVYQAIWILNSMIPIILYLNRILLGHSKSIIQMLIVRRTKYIAISLI